VDDIGQDVRLQTDFDSPPHYRPAHTLHIDFRLPPDEDNLPRLDYPGGLVGRWPQSYQRPDELVLDDLIKGLAASNEIDATAIEISCERGVIKASRSVETRAEQLVLEALSVSTIGAVDYDADVVVSKA